MPNNNNMMKSLLLFTGVTGLMLLNSCIFHGKDKSMATGWNYNDTKWGGFEVHDYPGQETGPNLQLVIGGSYVAGNTEQNVTYDYDNVPRKMTIASFYMDQTEVSNQHYREYLYWLSRVFGSDFPEVVRKALP
ncbi:MAG: formylglycine-generating enzyme family protein, partial [Chitinophagales bacterium]|nr:formylglycine-generating enzyme family protein [Chitinophagales bacterium]